MASDDETPRDGAEDETPEAREPEKLPHRGGSAADRPPELPDDPEELKGQVRRMQDALRKANKEAADRRRRLEELEEAETRRQEAKLSEDERVKRQLQDEARKRADAEARAAEAAAQLRQLRIDQAVEREALKHEFNEPDLVPRLVDPSLIEIDEDGRLVGVKEAVKKLAEQRPSLVRPKPRGGTPVREGRAAGGRGGGGDSIDAIKDQLLARGGYGSV